MDQGISRIKQNVQTTLRNTHDSTQGRLLAKKMKTILSQEKRYDRLAQDMTQTPDKEDSIELFFSHITPLPQGKYLLNLDEKQINIAPQLTISQSQTFFERATKKLVLLEITAVVNPLS